MNRTKAALALCICLVIVAPALAGNTAQISGIVADESGMPIAFATIRIEGTDIHATSDEDGYFSRSDVPPGQYNVTCSAPGFVDFTYVEIPFLTDMRRNVNFTMKRPDAETVLTITVHAEHRLIEPSLTTSIDYITAEDIEQLPADNFYDLMENEAGVTNDDGFMHVRGGRATEITYMVDDMPILDPVTGYAASSVNNSAIAEMSIISGTFSAEYGNAQSAVINITTKAGSTKSYEGMVRFRQELYQSTKEFGSQKVLEATGQPDWDSVPTTWTTRTRQGRFWKGEGSVGGPIGSFMTFFLSGDYSETGTQLIMPRPRWEYNAQTKLRFNFSQDMSLTFSGSLNQLYRPLFDIQYQYCLDNMYHLWRDSYQASGIWKHMINEKTYYTFRVNYFNSWYHYGVRWGEDDWHWENDPDNPGQEIQVWNNGDAWGEHQYGDMKWWEDYDTDWRQGGPDGWFYTKGDMRIWETRKEQIWTGKGDFTTELDEHNLIKAGLEYTNFDVDLFQRQPLASNTYGDKYHVFPWQGAVYVQDKMDYSEMIINLGLRFDYFDPNTNYPENPMDSQDSDPDSQYETFQDIPRVDAEAKYQLSPRLGVAHPISEFDKLHFSYGHFFQMPAFRYLYMGNYEKPAGAYPIFGNPDLKPEKTISYEIGIQHLFTKSVLLDITGFYKDVSGQLDTIRYDHPLGLWNYTRTTNSDWGNVRGVELVLDGTWTDWFSSKIAYTYSIARGLSSDWRQGYDYSYYGWNLPLEANLLDWDVTHTVNLMLDFRDADTWGANFNFSFGSGTPYSPPVEQGTQKNINSERMPWSMNLDAKVNYNINMWGMQFQLFVEALNIFDRWNVSNLGPDEGTGNNRDWTAFYYLYGDANGPWDDMNVYDEPFQLRVGGSVSF